MIGIFLGALYFKLHMLCAAPLYSPESWQWSLSLDFFYLSYIFFQNFLYKYFSIFYMIPAGLLPIIPFFFFLKLIILIVYFLKNSQNIFMQSLSIHASCLFSMLLNENIVDIEKSDMLAYFCCRLFFRITFASISLFYYTCKICINTK